MISDKLLSWVFGCKCEFQEKYTNNILFKFDNIKDVDEKYKKNMCCGTYYKGKQDDNECLINLYTFIHLAKIKACDKGYEVLQGSRTTNI